MIFLIPADKQSSPDRVVQSGEGRWVILSQISTGFFAQLPQISIKILCYKV